MLTAQERTEMFVFGKHLFFIVRIVEKALQLVGHVRHRELVGDTFSDDLFAADDIDEREVWDGEQERLGPPYETDELRACQMIDGYLRAVEQRCLQGGRTGVDDGG